MTRPDIEGMRARLAAMSDYADGEWTVDSTNGNGGPLVYNSVMPSKDENGKPEPILSGPQMSYAMWTCDDEEDGCPEYAREAIEFTTNVVESIKTDLPAALDYIASLEGSLRVILAGGDPWSKTQAAKALEQPK